VLARPLNGSRKRAWQSATSAQCFSPTTKPASTSSRLRRRRSSARSAGAQSLARHGSFQRWNGQADEATRRLCGDGLRGRLAAGTRTADRPDRRCRRASLWETCAKARAGCGRGALTVATIARNPFHLTSQLLAVIDLHLAKTAGVTLELRMCCDVSDSLVLARAFSDLLARVNNGVLTLRRLPRISLSANRRICRQSSMGREGFEPSTLGLRVDAGLS
jgi:hypothetical protein